MAQRNGEAATMRRSRAMAQRNGEAATMRRSRAIGGTLTRNDNETTARQV